MLTLHNPYMPVQGSKMAIEYYSIQQVLCMSLYRNNPTEQVDLLV